MMLSICRVRSEVWIGVIVRAIFIRETLGFDLHVERLRRLEAESAHIKVLNDVEHLQSQIGSVDRRNSARDLHTRDAWLRSARGAIAATGSRIRAYQSSQ